MVLGYHSFWETSNCELIISSAIKITVAHKESPQYACGYERKFFVRLAGEVWTAESGSGAAGRDGRAK